MNATPRTTALRTLFAAVMLVLAGGCAAPRSKPSDVAAAPAADPSAAAPVADAYAESPLPWVYPESVVNGWGTSCNQQATRQQQSPINFTNLPDRPGDALARVIVSGTFDPHDQNVVFVPTVTVEPVPGSVPPAPATYTPVGAHFHWTAEHVVAAYPTNGSLEMHIKATDALNNTAVFAIVWVATSTAVPDPTLTNLVASLRNHSKLDFGSALINFTQGPFYSYVGSLTTPPCSPGIRWYVFSRQIAIPTAQHQQVVAALVAAGLRTTSSGGPLNFRTPRALVSPVSSIYLVIPAPIPNN